MLTLLFICLTDMHAKCALALVLVLQGKGTFEWMVVDEWIGFSN